jgi:hypothetical protein
MKGPEAAGHEKAGAGGAVEMPGLWKAWKAKSRLPTLSTSPLEIPPKGGEIPTFPQLARSGLEKWKTKGRFPTFPSRLATTNPVPIPPNTPAALRAASGVIVVDRER